MRGQGLFKLTLIVSTFIIAVFFSGVSKPAMLNVLPSVNVVNDYLVSLLMNNIDAQISTILSEGAKPFGEISTEVSDDLLIVTPACTRYVNYSVIESYDTVIINPAWNETRLDNGSPVVIIHDAITQQVPIYRNVSMLEQWNCDTGIYADVSAEWTDDSKTNITININNYNVKDSSLLNKTLITKIVDKYNSKNKTLDTDMFTLINESKTKKINLRKEDVIGNELHLGENSAVYLINTTTQWNISNGLIKVVSLADTYNLQLWGYNGTEWINVGFLQPNPNNDNLGSAIITILENTPSKVILNITKGNIGYNLTLNGGAPYFSLINNTPQTTAYYLVKNYDIDNLSVYIKNSTTINFPLSSNINFAVSGSYYTLLFDAVKNYTTFFVVNKEHTDGTSDILIATTGEVYEKWTYQPTVTAVSFGVLMNINTSTQSGNTASNYSWDSWNVLGTAPTDYALYYNMNEGAGTTLDNKQGNNSLDGTLANTTAWKQSKKSHGLNTNIKNGWVTNANLGGWANGKSELSFAIWFKYTALQADKNIIGWWATNQANIKASGTSLTYQISTAGGIKSAVSGDVNDGNWHLAVGTYDGSYVRLFIDGVMSQETAQTGSIVSAGSDNFNVGVIVGSETFAFKGELDEAYVFDRNLTMQEIQGLYGKGLPDTLDNSYSASWNNVAQTASFAESFANASFRDYVISTSYNAGIKQYVSSYTYTNIPNDFTSTFAGIPYFAYAPINASSITPSMNYYIPSEQGSYYATLSTSLITTVNYSLSADESQGDTAIENGIRASLGESIMIYSNKKLSINYLNEAQSNGTFDKAVTYNNKVWAFNYITTGENYTNMNNITNTIYIGENQDMTPTQITNAVSTLINNTK